MGGEMKSRICHLSQAMGLLGTGAGVLSMEEDGNQPPASSLSSSDWSEQDTGSHWEDSGPGLLEAHESHSSGLALQGQWPLVGSSPCDGL